MKTAIIFFALFSLVASQLGFGHRRQIEREERAFERGLYAGKRSGGFGGRGYGRGEYGGRGFGGGGLYGPGVGGAGGGLYGRGVGGGLYQQPGVRLNIQEEIVG